MAYEKLKQELYKNVGGINTHVSQYLTGDSEVLDLRNFGFERPGSWTSRPGTEYHLTLNSGSFLTRPYNTFQYVQRSGASYLVFDSGSTLYVHAGHASAIFGPITGGPTVGLIADAENYDNKLFFANGVEFGFLSADNYIRYNLQKSESTSVNSSAGITFNTALPGPTAIIASGTWIVSFQYARGYDDIYQGPFYPANSAGNKFGVPQLSPLTVLSLGTTVVGSGKWVFYGFTVPTNYGISGLLPIVQRQADGATAYRYATPSTIYLTTITGTTFFHTEFDHPQSTSATDPDLSRNSTTVIPKYLAIFNNILVCAGQTTTPHTVFYSEPGQPDNIQPDNFFEIISDDEDSVNGLVVFQDALIVFKPRCIFELSGGSAQSFSLRELTRDFGLFSERGFAVFESKLWFIDQVGIIEYDGSNFKRISHEKVDSFLDSMDKSKVSAHHLKKRKEVWFCASNLSLVYNYEIQAWAIYDVLPIDKEKGPAVLNYGATRTDLSYWQSGASFHELIRFGDSLSTDLGQAITLMIKTKYHKRLEYTTQELWRRAFFNMAVPGSTQSVTIQLLTDFGASVYETRSIYADSFQKRIDFGISARSLAMKCIIQASQPIRIDGYTVESRFLRKV